MYYVALGHPLCAGAGGGDDIIHHHRRTMGVLGAPNILLRSCGKYCLTYCLPGTARTDIIMLLSGMEYIEMKDDHELSRYGVRDNTMLYLVVYRWGPPLFLQKQSPPYENVPIYGAEPDYDTILSLKLRLQVSQALNVFFFL